jgi:chromobox protein 1
LIEEYWRNKKKTGRKSLDPKPKTPSKGGRKSMIKDDSSEAESASVANKKRGRKSKAPKDSDVEMEEEVPAKKKSRKSNGNAKANSPQFFGEPIDDSVPYGNMGKWMTTKSWEHIVKIVDTVERTDSGGLDVYFTLYVLVSLFVSMLSMTIAETMGLALRSLLNFVPRGFPRK